MPLFPPSHHRNEEEPPPPPPLPPSQPHHEHSRFGGRDGEGDQGQYRDDRHLDDRAGRDGPPYQREPDTMDVGNDREREGQRSSMECGDTEVRPSTRFESFEYNHQSHPGMRGGVDRESHDSKPQIFDYNHQSNPPPPWNMDSRHGPPRPIPIPPPGFGPPHRFPPMDPKWGPPGPPDPRGPPGPPGPHGSHGPPGPPIMPPPDLPPPIPYYDLPAGITCLLVPVSFVQMYYNIVVYPYTNSVHFQSLYCRAHYTRT